MACWWVLDDAQLKRLPFFPHRSHSFNINQVGGRNRWAYDTFTNWEFYPSKDLPILVYFKETQTKPEGQIHFFPVIGDPAKLYDSFKKYVPLPGK